METGVLGRESLGRERMESLLLGHNRCVASPDESVASLSVEDYESYRCREHEPDEHAAKDPARDRMSGALRSGRRHACALMA